MAIWFDVTTILLWRRPPTGVVRVEAEIFKRLAAQREHPVRFCAFERATGRYVECAADEVAATLEKNAGTGTTAPKGTSAAKRLAEQADALLRKAPLPVFKQLSRLKKVSTPVLRDALHRWREARDSMGSLRKQRPAKKTVEPTTIFAQGDVLVSAGLDWDFKDLGVLFALKRALGLRVVLCCYDLIPVLLPHVCRSEVAEVFPGYYADVAWCADLVLCISRSSQRDFERYVAAIGAPRPATEVIPLGGTLEHAAPAPGRDPTLPGPYVLFVSTLERRKNHDVLYRALVRLAETGREVPTLVFVGMQGWGVDDLVNDLQRDPRVRGKVLLRHHASDAELTRLYRDAAFTVFPSLYEGWGLPVAESLAHGKFCLVANTSSLPEVGGDLVEYLDPWDVNAWAERMAHLLAHPEELARREERITREYRPTPWAETTKAVLEAAVKVRGS